MSSLIRICIVFVLLMIMLVVSAMIFDDRGYVFVEFNGWAIEMNVMSLAISIILVFVGLLLFNWLIKITARVSSSSRNWLGNLGQNKKQRLFRRGLLALAENDFNSAQQALSKIEDEDFNGINLLAQAEAALQLGQAQQAKALWHKAAAVESSALAATLCLVRDALQQQQAENALALIYTLNEKQREQVTVIKLWAQALAQQGKWQELKDKLPGWKKALAEHYLPLSQQATLGQFAEVASKEGATQLIQNWQNLPRAARKDPSQQAAYIQQLLDQGMHSEAEKILIEVQKSEPQTIFYPLMRQLRLPNPAGLLKKIEGWLKQQPENVELLSVFGHIAYSANDLALAERALAKAIKLAKRKEDVLLLAKIKEQQHDQGQALALYKQSLSLP